MNDHIIEKARGSAVWKKLEVYFPISTGHKAERALAQYKEDLRFQERIRKAVNGERERKPSAPRQTRIERWKVLAKSFETIWDFERKCMEELPRGERGAARDKAIAECAQAWRARGQ